MIHPLKLLNGLSRLVTTKTTKETATSNNN
jgi:hypothetical protein